MFLTKFVWVETFLGQIGALITFFAFPAIQYIILKRFSKKHGNPELWYLPAFGFRLVISNIPNKRTLSDLKYKSILRNTIPASSMSSVETYVDKVLTKNEEFFLFGNNDQIMVSFKIVGSNESELRFIHTDKLGNTIEEYPLQTFDKLMSDYSVNIENLFNFDIKVSKRVIIKSSTLIKHWKQIETNNVEQNLDVDDLKDV